MPLHLHFSLDADVGLALLICLQGASTAARWRMAAVMRSGCPARRPPGQRVWWLQWPAAAAAQTYRLLLLPAQVQHQPLQRGPELQRAAGSSARRQQPRLLPAAQRRLEQQQQQRGRWHGVARMQLWLRRSSSGFIPGSAGSRQACGATTAPLHLKMAPRWAGDGVGRGGGCWLGVATCRQCPCCAAHCSKGLLPHPLLPPLWATGAAPPATPRAPSPPPLSPFPPRRCTCLAASAPQAPATRWRCWTSPPGLGGKRAVLCRLLSITTGAGASQAQTP